MRNTICRWRPVVCAALAALALVGCQKWNWRGRGYDERENEWTKNLRPAADERRFSGLDERARDIERSLGVR